ncbi:MAG TPA: PASTA domain-containing protein [Pyrinomonadaceae bacterium]|nr:PASTA domain-containing protein [Pyrinomonadaceae bacterium]
MSFALQSLSALRRLGIVVLLAIAFLFGLATTVYLSLRSPEVTVPEVVGKDRYEAEKILAQADLNFRVRATRPSNQVTADTVLFQLPRAGEVVKVGQTVAMDISRTTLAGEASEADATDKKLEEEKAANANANAKARNLNENRPRRNRNTNANKNTNENDNADSGTNRNGNANSGRGNTNNANSITNRPINNGNTNSGRNTNQRNTNQNDNRRPVIAKPSPKPPAVRSNDNR